LNPDSCESEAEKTVEQKCNSDLLLNRQCIVYSWLKGISNRFQAEAPGRKKVGEPVNFAPPIYIAAIAFSDCFFAQKHLKIVRSYTIFLAGA